tara:strand:- start:444 stop:647 length:204 start_codon:yes stop_codon:yes gene_type:complete
MPRVPLELTDDEHNKLVVLKAHTKKKSFKDLFLWMADNTISDMGLDRKPAFSRSESVVDTLVGDQNE